MKCVAPLDASDEHATAEAGVGGSGPWAMPFGDARTVKMARTGAFAPTMVLAPPPARRHLADYALPEDTLIEGFRIIRPIGEGGFGIVYLAWDVSLERHVAIKEYMPSSLAVRADASSTVTMRSEQARVTFNAGLKSFVNEARLLARFDHPSLVKVFRFWEANRTAYMAMPYYEGPTLRQALARSDSRPTEAQLREWLHPLLQALSAIHRENCYHRDIAPDNILITNAGPLLLDFGAARRVISDMTQALTAVLKPGFAPIEQYGGSMAQGPWTDLYALAGVVYAAITGRPPVASVVRVVEDTLPRLASLHAGEYSAGFLRAIDAALAVHPNGRPQDVEQFVALLDAQRDAAAPVVGRPDPATAATVATPDVGGPVPSAAHPQPASSTSAADEVPLPAVAAPGRRALRRGLSALAMVAIAAAAIAIAALGSGARPDAPMPQAAVLPSPVLAPPAATVSAAPAAAPVAVASVQESRAKAPSPSPSPPPPPAFVPQSAPTLRQRPAQPVQQRVTQAVEASTGGSAKSDLRARADAKVSPSYKEQGMPPRCGDLVIKASLEALSLEEAAFLKRQCTVAPPL